MTYTHYDYLDLAPSASRARIDAAYADILERFGRPSVDAEQDLSALVREIHAAYEVLSNSERRQRYDAELERAARIADIELKEALDHGVLASTRIVQDIPASMLEIYHSLAA